MPINLASSPLTKLYLGNTEILKAYLGTIQVFPNFLLLDLYPSTAAFSLRKLRTAYSGSAVRVRRSSDNAEQNIGFNVNGGLDTTALNTFCTGANGFVTTWYDQQGSNNATKTTQANQPKIYDSVTGVITQNSKPAISFDGVDDFFESIAGIGFDMQTSSYSLSAIASLNSGALGLTRGLITTRTAEPNWLTLGVVANNMYVESGLGGAKRDYTSTFTPAGAGLQSYFLTKNNTSSFLYRNGTVIGSRLDNIGGASSTSATIKIGNWYWYSSPHIWRGTIQELIIYNTDQSSNRTAIETNINTHYTIY